MFDKREQGLGLRISAKADNNSAVSKLLGITDERRLKLEEIIDCEELIQGSNISVIKSISETAKTSNELAYSMFYFGKQISNPPVHNEVEVGDIEEERKISDSEGEPLL